MTFFFLREKLLTRSRFESCTAVCDWTKRERRHFRNHAPENMTLITEALAREYSETGPGEDLLTTKLLKFVEKVAKFIARRFLERGDV